MSTQLDIYDASTGLYHGQMLLPQNYSGQTLQDTRYLGPLRIECVVPTLPLMGMGGNPVQREDVQSLGIHIGNMAAATDRQALTLKDAVDSFHNLAMGEMKYLREDRDWWRDRANLLEAQMRLRGLKPPPVPLAGMDETF